MDYPDFTNALCRGIDTNEFYIEDSNNNKDHRNHELLSKMCAACPVLMECATWALHHELYGYWGGTTEKDRKAIRLDLGISYQPYESQTVVSRAIEGAKTKKRMREANNV